MSADKDHERFLREVEREADVVIVTQADHPRAAAAATLAGEGRLVVAKLSEALMEARTRVIDGSIVVCGSVFLAGEALAILAGEKRDPVVVTDWLSYR